MKWVDFAISRMAPLWHQHGGSGERLFEATMTADAVGQVVFSANPSDDLSDHQTVVVGRTLTVNAMPEFKFSSIPPNFVPPIGTLLSAEEDPVLVEEILYSQVKLQVVEPGSLEEAPHQNRLNPFDANANGNVSPIDLLTVLVEFKCQQNLDENGCDAEHEFYPDVDGDGEVTRHDILHVLNYDLDPPFAGADVYVARIGESLAISAADGVLRNDFTGEGSVVTATLVEHPDGLTLSEDGSFVWAPPDGFDDDEIEFIYSASDGRRGVNAKARILMRDIDDEQVIVSLRTVDATGKPIHEAAPGDTFFLEAYVEDTRPRPEGVFAAYVDVAFDADLAAVAAPIHFGVDFPNARHGSVVAGLLDEVGGLQRFDDYQQGGGVLLFSVPFTAESEGALTFSPDAADSFPEHYMLLLGIDQPVPAELIRFQPASIQIIDMNRAPIAQSDRYFGQPGLPLSVSASGGLLANDDDPDQDILSVRVIKVPAHGALAIESDGSFSYSPEADFTGTDTFTYVANDGEFDSETMTVTLDVRGVGDAVVTFRLQVLDDHGQPVDHVTVGDEFELRVTTEDVREHPQGVFAGYLDVEYNASRVSTVGEVAFGETYNVGRNAEYLPGLIDEAGAFTRSHRPVGGGEFILFSQRFTATHAGEVIFASNPADLLPHHEVLVYGLDDVVDPGDIDFGSAAVVNVPSSEMAFSTFALRVLGEGESPLGVADTMVVDFQVTAHLLDVLANDATTVSEITLVAGAVGTASIASDGRSLLYSAPRDFAGRDHFTYTVADSAGNTEVVAVDVQVKSPFQNFAYPTDTDSDGHVAPIDALYGVNELNRNGSRRLTDADAIGVGLSYLLDVNGDLYLAPVDVLIIINELNERAAANGEGESSPRFFAAEGDSDDDKDDETDDPSNLVPERVRTPNTGGTDTRSSLERVPSPSELFFGTWSADDRSWLDEDLIELLQEKVFF